MDNLPITHIKRWRTYKEAQQFKHRVSLFGEVHQVHLFSNELFIPARLESLRYRLSIIPAELKLSNFKLTTGYRIRENLIAKLRNLH